MSDHALVKEERNLRETELRKTLGLKSFEHIIHRDWIGQTPEDDGWCKEVAIVYNIYSHGFFPYTCYRKAGHRKLWEHFAFPNTLPQAIDACTRQLLKYRGE